MVPLVRHATAICAAALVALLPAASRADSFRVIARAVPALQQHGWALRLGHPRPLVARDLPAPLLPLSIDPVVASWWAPETRNLPLEIELRRPTTTLDAPRSVTRISLNLPDSVPPLIRYSDEATDVTLSISPGSPCTGACLKLAGSF